MHTRKTIICYCLLMVLTLSCVAQEVKLPVLRIYFSAKIKKNMPYSNGSMKLTDTNGNVIEMPAKFKTRGATAQQYLRKPSLNMKLRNEDYSEEADSALLGMRSCSSWILDAMTIDRICMRNRVAFDIWNEFSKLPYETSFDSRNGTEGRFIELYINDTYYGIYCLTDRINRKLLDLKKVKEMEDGSILVRGVLYKSGTSEISDQVNFGYNEDSTACTISYHNSFELTFPEDYGGKAAWQPLLEAFFSGKTVDYVRKYFYLENLADYQLLIMALSIGDNIGNKNHYLSIRNINKDIDAIDPNDYLPRRFVLTPWDLDTSLGGSYKGEYYNGNYSNWAVTNVTQNPFYPISAVQGSLEYKNILKKRWQQGRRGAFSTTSINKKLETYRDLFLKSGAWQRMIDHYDLTKSNPMLVVDLAKEIELIEQWYERRFREMDAYFGISDGIDEIMASQNASTSMYNLQGQAVSSQTKGIVIINHKKYLVK